MAAALSPCPVFVAETGQRSGAGPTAEYRVLPVVPNPVTLTHGPLASANILKTALYGWNPMAINLAQFQALARRMMSLAKLASERDRLIRQGLDDGWEALLADAREAPA